MVVSKILRGCDFAGVTVVRLLDILIPMLLIGLWLMPLSLLKKIWGLFGSEIKNEDKES